VFEDQVTNLSHVTAGCHDLTERVLSRRLLRLSNSPGAHEEEEDRARETAAPPDETACARRLLTRLRALSSARWKEVFLMICICNFHVIRVIYY
jgi:hypothetical protein